MNVDLVGTIFAAVGYVLGSIPFGILASRLCGVQDPRHAGSKNIGFTNVLRVSGKKAGILALIGDFGKGWLVAWTARKILLHDPWVLIVSLSVVAGHISSVFLRFRGGKGVATGLGCVLGVNPIIGGILICVWFVALGIWRYSSGGALAAFGVFPVIGGIMVQRLDFVVFSIFLTGMIYYRHKENLVRLANGTENRIRFLSS